MIDKGRALLFLAAITLAASAAGAHEGRAAPTIEGGLSWDILASAEVIEWTDTATGKSYVRPGFPDEVIRLDRQKVALSGFVVPYGDGRNPSHFLLFANEADCLFHMAPGPTGFVEVRAKAPVGREGEPVAVTGRLELVTADRGGIFYRLHDVEPLPAS